jgi:S-adenosylmethionine decarboxylase
MLHDKEYIKLKSRFEQEQFWGILSSIDIYKCNPDLIRDANQIKTYVKLLCDKIEMKRYGETVVVHFGQDPRVSGFSMTQLIETSLISGHFANESNNVYIDVFSCKFYHPWEVAEFTKTFFKAQDYSIHIVLRK